MTAEDDQPADREGEDAPATDAPESTDQPSAGQPAAEAEAAAPDSEAAEADGEEPQADAEESTPDAEPALTRRSRRPRRRPANAACAGRVANRPPPRSPTSSSSRPPKAPKPPPRKPKARKPRPRNRPPKRKPRPPAAGKCRPGPDGAWSGRGPVTCAPPPARRGWCAGTCAGKSVDEARAILAFTPREAARDWSKLLESAVANAESNHELLEEDLIVREAYADEGPTIKRFRPRAMGRATPIAKRTSHLTIGLGLKPEPVVTTPRNERKTEQMGQKVHPEAMRVGYIHDWKSNWFNERHFAEYLAEDVRVREHIVNKLAHAGLSEITIRKDANELEVNIHTARPGIVIGKSGTEVDALRRDLHRMTKKQIKVNILEIKRPELDAKLVAQSIAEQLQNRVAFRRAMKRALTSAMRSGAKGVKIQVAGRLGGAEMARTESYSDGRVPLHTMRADIDYGFYEARTTFGRIGVKCWVNKGEIMPEGYTGADLTDMSAPAPPSSDRDGRGRGEGGRGRGEGRGRGGDGRGGGGRGGGGGGRGGRGRPGGGGGGGGGGGR